MAPNGLKQTQLLEDEDKNINTESVTSKNELKPRKLQLVWRHIIGFSYIHVAAVYGLYLAFTSAKLQTNLFALLCFQLSLLGGTAGAHRLWAHRSYKAKWPMRLFLAFCSSISFQGPIFLWARDHRVHHKFSETDGDPHNAVRGLFFSHIGWLLCKKHPEVAIKGKQIDLSDLYNDPIVRFQKNYYFTLSFVCAVVLPMFIPWYFWNETIRNAWFIPTILRYCVCLNCIFFINSIAHCLQWGKKPYDNFIGPVDVKIIDFTTFGEGNHNYHHTFPWDYKGAELGTWMTNWTTCFIDVCSMLGMAYDMKTVSIEMLKNRIMRTGDGSHELWGWGDVDQSQHEKNAAIIIGKKTG